MNIQFQHSSILWGLLLLPIGTIYWLYLRKQQQKKIQLLGESAAIKKLIAVNYFQQSAKQYWLLMLSICCIIIAIADPSVRGKAIAPLNDGHNVVVALDVSNSMLSADLAPNRLANAKWVIENLVARPLIENIGLVLFAGDAFVQMPVTNDKQSIPLFIANANTDAVTQQGTNIPAALTTAMKALEDERASKKTIILFSDGENHQSNLNEVIKELITQQITVITIGLGTEAGANIIDETTKDAKRDGSGEAIVSKLEEQDLKDIANKTNGKYIAFKNTNQVLLALTPLLENNIINNTVNTRYSQISVMHYPAFVALFCLLFLMPINWEKLKKISKRVSILIVIMLLAASNMYSQNNNQLLYHANEKLKANLVDDAIDLYKKVLIKDSKNEVAGYNLGNAFLMKQQYELAANTYGDVLTNPNTNKQLKANAYYNQAYAYAKNKDAAQAITAFKKCLLLNPEDNDARENLQLLLNQTKQQKPPNKKPAPKKNDLLNEKLQQLKEEEKQLFKQINMPKTTNGNQEKDW